MARILIVDDQKSILLTLEAMLTSEGHAVVACTNAVDALDSMMRERFDLVITDAIMPGGSDGYALTKTIRKHPNLNRMPVILLTGKREKSDIERGIEAGVNDYIIKPMDPALLIAKVENLLQKKSQSHAQFAAAVVDSPAEWESKTQVTAVSELGLQLMTQLPLPLGKILRLKSPLFQEIGMSPVPLRIDSCAEVATQEGMYLVQAHFVGITEKELAPIRIWLRSKKNFK